MRIEDDLLDRSVEEGARLVALALVSEVDEAASRLEKREDAEALHDFRVGLRRLRSTLRAFRAAARWRVSALRLERRLHTYERQAPGHGAPPGTSRALARRIRSRPDGMDGVTGTAEEGA